MAVIRHMVEEMTSMASVSCRNYHFHSPSLSTNFMHHAFFNGAATLIDLAFRLWPLFKVFRNYKAYPFRVSYAASILFGTEKVTHRCHGYSTWWPAGLNIRVVRCVFLRISG